MKLLKTLALCLLAFQSFGQVIDYRSLGPTYFGSNTVGGAKGIVTGMIGTNAATGSLTNRNQHSPIILELQTNGVTKLEVTGDGDLAIVKSVTYSWPTGHGAANSVLTDTNGSGVLSWQAGGVSVAAGSNIVAITNTGLVTVEGLTDTNAVGILVTNQIPNFIHGSTNRIAKFTPNTNEVGNSIIINSSTNLVEYRPFDTSYTNTLTNLWYGEWTSASNWRGLELSTALNGNAYSTLKTTHGSGYSLGDDILLVNGWGFGAASPHGGQSIGGLFPFLDNTYDIGTSSLRIGAAYAGGASGHGFLISGQTGEPGAVNLGATGGNGYGFGVSLTDIQVFGPAGSQFAEFINTDVTEQGLNIGIANLCGNVFHAFGKPSIYLRGNPSRDVGVWQMGTNCTASGATVQPYTLTGIWGSGTDVSGGDHRSAGGVSTGTGTNGNWRVRTAQKATSTSSTPNTLRDRMVVAAEAVALTTNTATTVATIALPTSGKHVGVKVFATTTISDGVDQASVTESFIIDAWNKAGTVTTHTSAPASTDGGGTGSASIVSTTWTATVSSTTVSLKNNVVTAGINSTNSTCEFQLNLNSNDAALAVVPQL